MSLSTRFVQLCYTYKNIRLDGLLLSYICINYVRVRVVKILLVKTCLSELYHTQQSNAVRF